MHQHHAALRLACPSVLNDEVRVFGFHSGFRMKQQSPWRSTIIIIIDSLSIVNYKCACAKFADAFQNGFPTPRNIPLQDLVFEAARKRPDFLRLGL